MPYTPPVVTNDGGSSQRAELQSRYLDLYNPSNPINDWYNKTKTMVSNYQNKQNSTSGIGNKTVGENKPFVPGSIPASYGKYNVGTPKNSKGDSNSSSSSSSATYDGTGVGAGANASWDDIIEKIKALLNQQKTSADAYQKSLYEQALETARQSALNNQRQANRNYYAQNRRIGEMYGDDRSGMPMTQRFAAYSNLNNALAANDRDYANAKQTALTNYNSGLANNASTLAQGWYNYVLPVYTNRQQAIDNLNFYKSTL